VWLYRADDDDDDDDDPGLLPLRKSVLQETLNFSCGGAQFESCQVIYYPD
jgi:hypothetical protein